VPTRPAKVQPVGWTYPPTAVRLVQPDNTPDVEVRLMSRSRNSRARHPRSPPQSLAAWRAPNRTDGHGLRSDEDQRGRCGADNEARADRVGEIGVRGSQRVGAGGRDRATLESDHTIVLGTGAPDDSAGIVGDREHDGGEVVGNRMPFVSSMVTWGWGERAMPPEPPPGSVVNARLAAAPDTTAEGAMG